MDFLKQLGFDIKKNGNDYVKTYHIPDNGHELSIDLYIDDACTEIFSVNVLTISQETIELYSKFHCAFCKRRLNDNKKFILCYDLRNSSIPLNMDRFKDLIAMKQSLSDIYQTSLICTILIVENEAIKVLLNTVFKTIYTPVRPVRLVKTAEDVKKFLTANLNNEVKELYSEEQ